MLAMISLLPSKNERQRSVNDIFACILDNLTAMQRHCPVIVLSAAIMRKNATDDITTVLSLYAHVFKFTNMHVMSHRSDLFVSCNSKVDI